MNLKDFEMQALITAAAIGAFFGKQSKREIRASYRKQRDKKNRMAQQSRKRSRR